MIVCVLQLSFSLLYLVNLFVLWKHVFLFAELFQWKISAKISLQFTCELSLNLVTEQYPPWWYLDSAVCSVWISSLECKRRMKEAGRGNFTQRLHCSCVYCKKQETGAGWELIGSFWKLSKDVGEMSPCCETLTVLKGVLGQSFGCVVGRDFPA